jgi:hypothetical protein
MGSVIEIQTVFVAAGVLTAVTGVVSVLVLRGAARVVRPAVGEVT